MSLDEVRIKMDQGAFTQFTNGHLKISRRAGCGSWGLFAVAALMTLGAAVSTVYVVTVLTIGAAKIAYLLQGLGLTAFLGYVTFYLFGKVRFEEVNIDSSTRLITIGNRVIPFLEVKEIVAEGRPVPLVEGIATNIIVLLNSGERVILGSITGKAKKIDQPVKQIIITLFGTIKGKG